MQNTEHINTSTFDFVEAVKELSQNKWSLIIMIFVFLLNIHFLFKNSRIGTSPLSRIKTVECLLEHGTFETSKSSLPSSIDAISIDGKFYSDKPPLFSVVMAAEAIPLHILDIKISKKPVFYEKYFLLINQVIPFFIMLILEFHLMILIGIKKQLLPFGILALSVSNLTMAYTVSIINHVPSAIFCFLGFYIIALTEIKKLIIISKKQIFITGILLGLAISYEIYALALYVCISAYVFIRYKNINRLMLLGTGALIPIIIGLTLNKIITGSILPFYFIKKYFLYKNSYWLNPVGFDALNDSILVYLYNITLGHHGVFIITPLLLLFFLPIKNSPLKQLYNWCKISGVLTLIMMVVFTNNYGGYAIGFRFCIFLLPIFLFYGIHTINQYHTSKIAISLFIILILLSTFSVVEGLNTDPLTRGSIDKFIMGEIR
jgi:hypothetical protein